MQQITGMDRAAHRTALGRTLGGCVLSIAIGTAAAWGQTADRPSAALAVASRSASPRSAAPALHRAPVGSPGMHARIHPHAAITAAAPAAPHPTWEMPRTTTPEWETPSSSNPVQPNPVQGNPAQHSDGYGYGYGVGYAGIPGYYIDPLALSNGPETDPASAGHAGPAPDREEYVRRPEPPAEEEPEPHARAPYRGQGTAVAPPEHTAPVTDGLDHPEVILIFNDGRPPLKIHSYAVTASSVFVAEGGHQQQIPLSTLDLNATIQRNHAAGVDFSVPAATR